MNYEEFLALSTPEDRSRFLFKVAKIDNEKRFKEQPTATHDDLMTKSYQEILSWCEENCEENALVHLSRGYVITVYFSSTEDLVKFKLTMQK